MTTEEKMLKNFIQKYGVKGLRRITELFIERASNQTIADEFDVTRQRVHQWQKAFVKQRVELRDYVHKALHPSH